MTNDHIKIGDVEPRIRYLGDGVQTQFGFTFPIFEDEDLKVFLGASAVPESSGYTVTGAGQSVGGTVTFETPPGDGVAVTLLRDVAIKRTTDFSESGDFRASVINNELDRLTAVAQQLSNQVGRSVRLADTDADGTLQLPPAGERAGRLAGFDAAGNLIAAAPGGTGALVSGFMETLLDDQDAAAALGTLGAQPLNGDLEAIAALTPDDGDLLTYADGAWTAAPPASSQTTGTWTPQLTFANPGDLSVSYAAQNGTYLRIGDFVHATFEIVTSAFSHSTSSGNCQIAGLPFSASGNIANGATNGLRWGGINKPGYSQVLTYVSAGSDHLRLEACGMGQSATAIVASEIPSLGSVVLIGSVGYRAISQ
ncbi:hypothetical protein [Hwanghaeella sp.]|uniref:hypothetical protein n=1 Tax=Hwanghaeella sp. TaxID=2605943 RepID=UPI003CCBB739